MPDAQRSSFPPLSVGLVVLLITKTYVPDPNRQNIIDLSHLWRWPATTTPGNITGNCISTLPVMNKVKGLMFVQLWQLLVPHEKMNKRLSKLVFVHRWKYQYRNLQFKTPVTWKSYLLLRSFAFLSLIILISGKLFLFYLLSPCISSS